VLTAPLARKLDDHLDGRTVGPLFTTKTGKRMGQPEAWKMVRRLARRASLDGTGENPAALLMGSLHHQDS